jgi:hypothetical protein
LIEKGRKYFKPWIKYVRQQHHFRQKKTCKMVPN